MKTVTKRKIKCAHCGRRFTRLRKGRPARYCSPSCRQRAYEARKIERVVSAQLPARLMQADIDGAQTRGEIRRAVIFELRELGILSNSPGPTRLRSKLRLVKSEQAEDKDDPPPTSN